MGPVFKPDLGQGRKCRLAQKRVAPCRLQEAEAVSGLRLHRQRDILERGELAKDRGDLERAADAEGGAARRAEPRYVSAGEADRTGIGAKLAGGFGDQRGLAG